MIGVTRYSYFFETFEGFAGQDDDRALPALKYMCLCKIMMNVVRTVLSPLLVVSPLITVSGF